MEPLKIIFLDIDGIFIVCSLGFICSNVTLVVSAKRAKLQYKYLNDTSKYKS